MNHSDLMDFYLEKACKDAALEALERVKAAIEERIITRGDQEVTAYTALRIAQSFVSVAREKYSEAENAYITAAKKTLEDASAEKEERESKRLQYL